MPPKPSSEPSPAPSPDQDYYPSLSPTQLTGLRNFWNRLDAILYPSPSKPIDPEDVPLQSIIATYGNPSFQTALWNWIMMDDPDVMLCKFLRARKFELTASLKMLINSLKWRIERNVDGITETEEIGTQLATGKAFIQGIDLKGSPIFRIFAAKHLTSAQTPRVVEDFVIYSIESVRLFMTPPNETATIYVDLSGFGTSSMDWKCTSFMINCLESYYPETLNTQIIHNAPWIFQGIWKIISTMLDPVVKAKVTFTKSNQDLQKIIHPSNLLKSEAGESDFKWTYEPPTPPSSKKSTEEGTQDEEINQSEIKTQEIANRAKLIEIMNDLTRQWASKEVVSDPKQVVQLTKLRALVKSMLRAHYFKLLPLIKPSSIYFRHQNLSYQDPGVIKFTLNSTSNPINQVSSGKEMSRDSLLIKIQDDSNLLKSEGIELPAIDFEL